jgi:hypothetical protein
MPKSYPPYRALPTDPAPLGLEIMPVGSTTLWTTDKTAALTVAVDSTVLFNGMPTLKITIPAGTSGAIKVGTSGANALVPYGWDRENFALAVMYSGFTGYNWTSTFPPALTPYIGDATLANFWAISSGAPTNLANVTETIPRADEWAVFKPAASTWATGAGAPAVASKMRCKLQWTQVSQATDCYIHVGFFGKLPERSKATVIWTFDDGYASWDSFIKPLFKHHNMPATMGISSGGSFLNAAQIQALYRDESRLFDIVNHAVDNTGYTALGAADYYAQVTTCRDYLRGLGIDGDGPLHHPLVQSQWGNDLADLLAAGGFLTSRVGAVTNSMHGRDQMLHTGQDKLRWLCNATIFLGSAKSFNDAKTVVDAAVTAKAAIMIGSHDFAATADTYVWTYDDMNQLAAYVSGLMRAGTLEVKSWTKWYADLTDRETTRR